MRFGSWGYVLAMILAIAAAWWIHSTPPRVISRVLYDIKPESVTYLKIVNSKGTLILERDGDSWIITEPLRSPADKNSVGPLLQQLATAEHKREIPIGTIKPGSLEAWNLEPPATRVTFRANGKTYELLLGRDVAANNLAYARCSGLPQEPVRLVSPDLKRAMEAGLPELRSRRLFDFDVRLTSTVGVRQMNPSGQIERECEVNLTRTRGWALQKPVQARADVKRLGAWLNIMLGLTVIDFVTDTSPNPSTYGLSSPSAHIWVIVSPANSAGGPDLNATAGSTEIALEIGAQVPDRPDLVYACKPGSTSVFAVSSNVVEELMHGLADVRDRRIFPFPPELVGKIIQKLTIQKGGTAFTLIRNADFGWDMTTGDNKWRADKAAVETLLISLLSEQVERFVKDTSTDLKAYGLDQPQARITFGLKEENRVTTFEVALGSVEKGLVFVRNSVEPAVVSTSDRFLEGLPDNPLMLRHLQTIDLDRDQFASLQVTKKSGGYTMKRDADGKLVCDVKDYVTDLDRAEEMLQILTQLRAAQWVGLPKPEYGLDTPDIVATLVTSAPAKDGKAGEEKKVVLRVGSGTLPGGLHYAQRDGEPYVFALAAEDFAMLETAPVKPPGAPSTPIVPRTGPNDLDLPGDIPAGKTDSKP